jgi:hypothetical protein
LIEFAPPRQLKRSVAFDFSMLVRSFAILIVLLLSLLAASCESYPDTAIFVKVNDQMPPTFSFSGPWWARDFQIRSVVPHSIPKDARDTDKYAKKIWFVTLGYNKGVRATELPSITYGTVPSGWTQEFPNNGAAPQPLTEGVIYIASAIDNFYNGGNLHFIIQNGKAVKVSGEDLFKETADNSNVAR